MHIRDDGCSTTRTASRILNTSTSQGVYALFSSCVGSRLSGAFNIVGHLDLVKKFGHSLQGLSEQIRLSPGAREGRAVESQHRRTAKPLGEIYPSDDILSVSLMKTHPRHDGLRCHANPKSAVNNTAASQINAGTIRYRAQQATHATTTASEDEPQRHTAKGG
jgi:hypothetical protein